MSFAALFLFSLSYLYSLERFFFLITPKSVYTYIWLYLVFFIFYFLSKNGAITSSYLNYSATLGFLRQYKLAALYFIKRLQKGLTLRFLFLKNNFILFIKSFRYVLSNLLWWKPLFRKISYFGFFMSTKIKWLSKNATNRS